MVTLPTGRQHPAADGAAAHERPGPAGAAAGAAAAADAAAAAAAAERADHPAGGGRRRADTADPCEYRQPATTAVTVCGNRRWLRVGRSLVDFVDTEFDTDHYTYRKLFILSLIRV